MSNRRSAKGRGDQLKQVKKMFFMGQREGKKEVEMRMSKWWVIGGMLALAILVFGAVGAWAATITVGPSGCDHTTIQAAINAASDGDTINVAAGTYNETIDVPNFADDANRLTIQSTAGPATTIIDCGGATNGVQIVSNDITFSGFTVQNAYNLISQVSGNDHVLSNLILTDFVNYGMSVLAAHDCAFSNITIHGNDVSNSLDRTVKGIDIQEYGSGGNTNNTFEDITIYDIETTGDWGTSFGIYFEGDNPGTHPTTGNTFTNTEVYNLTSAYFNCGVYILDGSFDGTGHINPYAIENTTFSGGSIHDFTESDGDVVSRGFYVKGGNKNLDITGLEITDADEGVYFKGFDWVQPPTFPPAGWTNNSNWQLSTGGTWVSPRTGTYAAGIEICTSTPNDYLVMPQRLVQSGDTVSLYAHGTHNSGGVHFQLKVSTTGTDPADFTDTLGTYLAPTAFASWLHVSEDLSASYNGQTIYVAVYAYESTPGPSSELLVDDVTLPDGSTEGFEGATTTVGAVDVTVNNNSIHGNSTYGVDNTHGVGTINAENNWWGSATGPYHATTNPSGLGNAVSDNVDYSPYWANAAMTGSSPVHNTTKDLYYSTIQAAIDGASNSDSITVADGTYTITSAINVNKEVTITGNVGSPENVLVTYAAAQDANDGFEISAADITIQGIKVKNCAYGFRFRRGDTSFTGCTITHCAVETAAKCGIGEIGAPSTTISYNTITDCGDKGIFVRKCESASEATRTAIVGNTLSDCGKTWGAAAIQTYEGKFVYICDNTIGPTNDKGINIIRSHATGTADRIQVIDNNISLCKFPGIQSFGAPYTYIYNNTLTKCNYHGDDGTPDFDYASITVADDGAVDGSHVIVDNNEVSDGGNGILIWSDNCMVTNNDIYDMGLSYLDSKPQAGNDGPWYNSAIVIGGLYETDPNDPSGTTITGNSIHDNYWGLQHDPRRTNNVTAEDNWWGTTNGPEHSGNTYNVGSQGDKVSDNVDYLPWYDTDKTGTSFAPVTTDETPVGKYSSIQAAIDGVTGTIITCAAGTYTENVTINKSLTLNGANVGINAVTGTRVAESIIDGSTTTAVSITASGVTLDGFTITIGTKVADDKAGGVVIANNTSGLNNVTVKNNIVKDISDTGTDTGDNCTYGILTWGTTNGPSTITIQNNAIQNVEEYGICINDKSSAVTIDGNSVTNMLAADRTAEAGPNIGVAIAIGGSGTGPTTVAVTNNTLNTGLTGTGMTSGSPGGVGIGMAYAPTGVTITGNDITGNSEGIAVQSTTAPTAHQNKIHGNTVYGVHNHGAAPLINAEYNWWGSCGPSGEGPGTGDKVSTNVDFDPWYTTDTMGPTGPTATMASNTYLKGGYNLVSVPLQPMCSGDGDSVFDEAGQLQFRLLRYNPGIPGYNVGGNLTVNPEYGFWLYLSGDDTLIKMGGTDVTPGNGQYWKTEAFGSGWQQIGAPFRTVLENAEVRLNSTSPTDPWYSMAHAINEGWLNSNLFTWNSATQKYVVAGYDPVDKWSGLILYAWDGCWVDISGGNLEFNFLYDSSVPTKGFSPKAMYPSAVWRPISELEPGAARPPAPPMFPQGMPVPNAAAITQNIDVMVAPNPVQQGRAVEFRVVGDMAMFVSSVSVQVYTIGGQLVFDESSTGQSMTWNLTTLSGEPVANGLYLYVAQMEFIGGQTAKFNKLLILK